MPPASPLMKVKTSAPVPALTVLAPLTRADLLVEVDGLAVVDVRGD